MGMIEVTPDNHDEVSLSIGLGTLMTMNEDQTAYLKAPSQELVSEKPKRKRRTKETTSGITVEDTSPDPDLPMLMQNTPYAKSFEETDNMLRSVVNQIDMSSYEIGEDLKDIRGSRTIRNKYTYISNLESSRSSLLSSKIAAIREMNSSIKSGHDLDLKRAKEMKLDAAAQDDNKSIQDIYNAFVTMPVNQEMMNPYSSALGPSSMALTQNNGMLNPFLMNQADPNIGYNDYLNNLSPEQMTMMIEENPHINHVVKYNRNTGAAEFAVYDSQSNKFIDGIPVRSAEMYMPSMQFDFDRGIAHSNDLNESYDIIFDDAVPQNNTSSSIFTGGNGKDMSNY